MDDIDPFRVQPGELFADYQARLERELFHPAASAEDYREALVRHTIDYASWLQGFLAGTPDSGPAPGHRVIEAGRARVMAQFHPLIKALRAAPIEENPTALARVGPQFAQIWERINPAVASDSAPALQRRTPANRKP